jgi:hypothetical protein
MFFLLVGCLFLIIVCSVLAHACKDDGMAWILPKMYFLTKGKGKDIDAFLDQCKGMRYVGNNEIPQHDELFLDNAKDLVEPRGTGIVSRTLTI